MVVPFASTASGPRVNSTPAKAAAAPAPAPIAAPIPVAPAGTAGKRSNAGPGGGGFPHRADIAGLIAFAADGAFFVIQFLAGAAVEAGHVGPEIARGAVRKRQRIEAQMKFPAPFHLARAGGFR